MPDTSSTARSRGTRSRWSLIVAAVLLVAGAVVLTWQRRDVHESGAQHAARLSARHGIVIGFGPPETFFTPPYHAEDARAPGFEPQAVDVAGAAIALDGIESALEQYPPGAVAKLIKAIFICGELRMDGVRAGGTAGPAWIILAAPHDIGPAAIRLTSYLGVHHELSSFVLRHDPKTLSEWTALEPPGATFVDAAGAALARDLDTPPDPSTGFLSAYGATNPENDFNVYAEKMFTDAATLANLAKSHAAIARKLAFVRTTYAAVDPRFDAMFAKLGL